MIIMKYVIKKNNVKMQQTKCKFNLRKVPQKKYIDDNKECEDEKKLPIYKTKLLKSPSSKQVKDPYEFNDFATKKTNLRRSSIVFDKNIHNIMQKIEEKELKKKKPKGKIVKSNNNNRTKIKKENAKCQKNQQLKANKPSVTHKNSSPHSIDTGIIRENEVNNDNHINILEVSPPASVSEFPILEEQHSDNNITPETNANSSIGSPWRLDWITCRPHFLNVKNNALPSIDQEMIIDSNLMENVATVSSPNPQGNSTVSQADTSKKQKLVQSNLRDFLHLASEKNRTKDPDRSLFDYEELEVSPIKKNPKPRTVLGDLTNTKLEQELSYFGFNNESQPSVLQDDHLPPANWRFEPNRIKNYKRKSEAKNKANKENKEKENNTSKDIENEETDISLMEGISMTNDANTECLLFQEPEETHNDLSISDVITCHTKPKSNLNKTKPVHKRHKTKFEIEQEKWIKQFQNTCEDIDKYQLEIE